jgi:uncharacterized protein (TIGR02145 family)
MKNIFRISGEILFIFLMFHCRKDNTSSSVLPSVTTTAVTEISYTTAISGGKVTNDGVSPVVSRGVCWNSSFNPTIENNKTVEGSGSGLFTSKITQLSQNTFYYIRAYATNSAGTVYGNQENFTTSLAYQPGMVTDADGNIYDTIIIGTQIWLKENLKTTRYNNGLSISMVIDNWEWYNLKTPGCCWYDNDLNNKTAYGALYNWYAVDSASNGYNNLCPTGWHVPSDEDWTVLTTYLGGYKVAVGKLKETGTIHWQSPNTRATNESGFTALPGGCRDYDGTYYVIGSFGYWWSSTGFDIGAAWSRFIGYDGSGGYSYGRFEQDGFSVRCVKNYKQDK